MENSSTIIDQLGGTAHVAMLCGVSPQAVSHWRHRGIPQGWLRFLEAIKPEAFSTEKQSGAA